MEPSTFSVLSNIFRSQPLTRRALSDQANLSINHVSTIVSQLISQQLVREDVSRQGAPGRPPALLSVNSALGQVVGLDVGGQLIRAVLIDLQGQVAASAVHPIETAPDRSIILNNITRLVEAVCVKGGVQQPGRLIALGVGVRGIVNTQTGVVLDWPNTPIWADGWKGLDVRRALGSRLGVDLVVVDDSVRAMGFTARRFGIARKTASFLYVFLGNGIGSGVFLGGYPYVGSTGLAGELGHIVIDENGPWCSCGNRGCLEMMASTAAVLRRVNERLAQSQLMSTLREPYERGELSLPALIEAARAGDKLAFRILDETGSYVGQVLAIALNLLGPELVVLGGPLARDGGFILRAVQHQVRLRALQPISKAVRIVCDDGDDLAGARGAALLALETVFRSKEHLARLLENVALGRSAVKAGQPAS